MFLPSVSGVSAADVTFAITSRGGTAAAGTESWFRYTSISHKEKKKRRKKSEEEREEKKKK